MIMTNEELINRMKDYVWKMMPREIGYKRTKEWLDNYKFPESNKDLIKLYNIWLGTVHNTLMDMDKPSKEELYKEYKVSSIKTSLMFEVSEKYNNVVGPTNVSNWLSNYKFPEDYDEISKVRDNWNNIISELNQIKISKSDLYKDLAEYYKGKSKLKYYKYKLLTLYEKEMGS